jgi:hypothetical protein
VPRHVFLSYAREDVTEAKGVADALKAEGLPVWIDLEGIKSGNWKERVTEGLNRARALVFLLTPNGLESHAVRKELFFAAIKQVPVTYGHMSAIKATDLPDWFTLDYGELHRPLLDPEHYDEGVRFLASAIRSQRRTERASVEESSSD